MSIAEETNIHCLPPQNLKFSVTIQKKCLPLQSLYSSWERHTVKNKQGKLNCGDLHRHVGETNSPSTSFSSLTLQDNSVLELEGAEVAERGGEEESGHWCLLSEPGRGRTCAAAGRLRM